MISTNVVPSLDAALEQKESEGRALREAVKATEDNLEARVQENALLQVIFLESESFPHLFNFFRK